MGMGHGSILTCNFEPSRRSNLDQPVLRYQQYSIDLPLYGVSQPDYKTPCGTNINSTDQGLTHFNFEPHPTGTAVRGTRLSSGWFLPCPTRQARLFTPVSGRPSCYRLGGFKFKMSAPHWPFGLSPFPQSRFDGANKFVRTRQTHGCTSPIARAFIKATSLKIDEWTRASTKTPRSFLVSLLVIFPGRTWAPS